jgi:hypothetical protein
MGMQLDIGKALVVAQDDVEARPVFLDQVVFQQQRLGLGLGDRDLDMPDELDQRFNLGRQARLLKIAADAIAQRGALPT